MNCIKIATNQKKFQQKMLIFQYLLYSDNGSHSDFWERWVMQFQIGSERRDDQRKLLASQDESGCMHILAFPFHQEISSDPSSRKSGEKAS